MKRSLPFHHGKRDRKKKVSKRVFFIKIICNFVLLFVLIFFLYYFFRKPNKSNETNTVNKLVENTCIEQTDNTVQELDNTVAQKIEEPPPKEDEKVDVSYLPEKMGKYNVIGELVIDKIGVKNNILDPENPNNEKAVIGALNLSVVKFYGPDINTAGNFSITGHNYNGLLKRVKELELNDTFYLINRATGTKVNYKIYNIYTCDPYDTTCLDAPQDNNVREVTLITCNPGGLTRRICKAKEI